MSTHGGVPLFYVWHTLTPTALPLHLPPGLQFNPAALQALVTKNTSLVAVNFPHNPTGFVPTHEQWAAVVATAADVGAHLFCDEMYRGLELQEGGTLQSGVDVYDKAVVRTIRYCVDIGSWSVNPTRGQSSSMCLRSPLKSLSLPEKRDASSGRRSGQRARTHPAGSGRALHRLALHRLLLCGSPTFLTTPLLE